jgi:hypothetical protein
MSAHPARPSGIEFPEDRRKRRHYEIQCQHKTAARDLSPVSLLSLVSLEAAECRSFDDAHGESAPFRRWWITYGSIRYGDESPDIKITPRAEIDRGLASLIRHGGAKVALRCPVCPVDSEVSPVKLARAMDRIADRADQIGMTQIPFIWVSKEIDRLGRSHGRAGPYWVDAQAVYCALGDAAYSAEPGKWSRQAVQRRADEIANKIDESAEWYR